MRYRVVCRCKTAGYTFLFARWIEDINFAFWQCMSLNNDFFNYVEEETDNDPKG